MRFLWELFNKITRSFLKRVESEKKRKERRKAATAKVRVDQTPIVLAAEIPSQVGIAFD